MGHGDGLDEALAMADAATGRPVDALLRRLADRVGAQTGASAVYGDPVSADGVTVIPVARARWGFGGGAGEGGEDEEHGSGAGGGGGGSSNPVGYIELGNGSARYVPIFDPAKYWPIVLAAGVSGWLLLRGLRGLRR